jgi:hypothetical protein
MSRVPKERLFVASYGEIALLFVGFSLILFLLYPRDAIRKQVLSESSNYDLTIAYLQNMLKRDPKNEILMLALIKAARKEGNIDLGLKLIETIEKSKNPKLLSEAERLRYMLLKQRYTYESEENKKRTIKEMKRRFEHIYKQVESKEDIVFWYEEAIFLQLREAALQLALDYLVKEPGDVIWLKKAYYLCAALHCSKRSELLDALITYDEKERETWLEEAYRFAIRQKAYRQAETYIKLMKRSKSEMLVKEAKLALALKRYEDAAVIYTKLYKKSADTKWLKMAIDAYLAGGKRAKAVTLAKQYESCYYDDDAMMQWYLRFYLRSDTLEEAVRLSKILLQRNGNE